MERNTCQVLADPERQMCQQSLAEAKDRNTGQSRVTGRVNEDKEGRGGVGNNIGTEKW
jgi:hypothetical protein